MRQWLPTAAVLLTLSLLPLRAEAACPVHQDLSGLNRASAGFLSYLETGEGAYYVQQLNSWIGTNPPAPLKQRMRAVGIQQVEAGTLKLMQQSTVLLQILSSQGRQVALETARHMGVFALQSDYGIRVEALPCDQIKEDGFGSKLVAINANDARQRQQIINAAIAWVSFLVLGGSVLYFLDRIGIRKIRRTKRYPCAVPCVLQAGGRTVRGHLVDLSRAGAKVHPDTQVDASGRVKLNFGGYTVDAQVRWKTADYVGVQFIKEFNFMQLHRLLEEFPMEEGGMREEVRLGL
ncbi:MULTISPECIES: PilZ domain-containing protein [unclassified Leisingera]|uniref:PilZ domain-containing protein n=1 Tax=unclassified Leisingera TaxID=2614906 RepID=UPI00031A624F|nr:MULTISPECIES: PilZ domain-containing protein [unclassified Leisingera]KIC25362.1 pilus assembly protein PilZ [Leisingera sp. ANG-S3]KIC54587.1 pilus assembly protein PilZ [Leisingera sp. ANG-S]KID10647.1 pilus assembly protein PilZ [Leisingera sp. ANG1]